MIALDTNAVLRLLLNDESGQNAVVRNELEAAASAGMDIVVNDVVLAETMWTLTRAYGTGKPELVSAIRAVMGTSGLRFENTANVSRALDIFEKSKADFADCLIVAKNAAMGCVATLTFDKAMRTLPGVKILST